MELTTKAIGWLSGKRVLLLGHYVPAPLAAYFLYNFGAEVVKLEDLSGDHLRQMAQAQGPGMAAMFRQLNGGFRSLSIDHRHPDGAALLRRLIPCFDVVIDGWRAGALAACIGHQPTALAPHIIYVTLTAYGHKGPLSKQAGHDNNALAIAGNLSYGAHDAHGLPTVFSAPVADIFAGQMAAMTAIAALLGKSSGTLQHPVYADTSMLHAAFFLNFLQLAERNAPDYQVPSPGQQWMNGLHPYYRSYRCADGEAIFFGPLEPHLLARFLKSVDAMHLMQLTGPSAHFAYEQLFAAQPRPYWLAIGEQSDACITPVNDLEQAIAHPQVQALGLIQEVSDPELGSIQLPSMPLGLGPNTNPPPLTPEAPALGAHNNQVLRQLLGLSDKELADLRDARILP